MAPVRLAACAAFAAALGFGTLGMPLPAGATGHPPHDHSGGPGSAGAVAPAAASLQLEPKRLRAGERAILRFSLVDAAGEPLGELVTSHQRKLHAVIVSEDMAVFGHVHPEDFGEAAAEGEAKVFFTFPQGGRYLVGVDFVTTAGPQTAAFAVDVEGPPAAAGAVADPGEPRSEQVRLAADDSYTEPILLGRPEDAAFTVDLEAPTTIRVGEAATFLYRFARDGAAMDGLRPYLGAAMHVAVVKNDLTAFMHGHGESVGAARAEAAHGGHVGHGEPNGSAFGPEVAVTLTFAEPGRYFLFGQAARGDQMLVSRMAVEVQ